MLIASHLAYQLNGLTHHAASILWALSSVQTSLVTVTARGAMDIVEFARVSEETGFESIWQAVSAAAKSIGPARPAQKQPSQDW